MVQEYKKRYPNSKYTWVQFVGTAMGCINSSKPYGRHSQAPYTHVFVQDFRFPTSVATRKLREAKNAAELSAVLGDDDVTERLGQMGELGEPEECDDSEEDLQELLFEDVKHQFQELLDNGNVTFGGMIESNNNNNGEDEKDDDILIPDENSAADSGKVQEREHDDSTCVKSGDSGNDNDDCDLDNNDDDDGDLGKVDEREEDSATGKCESDKVKFEQSVAAVAVTPKKNKAASPC
jgi:hypothetical protein